MKILAGQRHYRSAVRALATVLEGFLHSFARSPVITVDVAFARRFVEIGVQLAVVLWLSLLPQVVNAGDPVESGASSESQAADDELAEVLTPLLDRYQLPAMWVGKFYTDGRQVSACVGVRAWSTSNLAHSQDRVHIGSCTKAMTAVLIAQCCSRGDLTFDSQLKGIFPDEAELQESPWGTVTVRELLEHRSGAPANPNWLQLDAQHPADAVAARRALLRWLVTRSRPRKPRFLYSNTGYALLGHVVEQIEQESWERVLQRRLAQPLEMSSVGFGAVGSDGADPSTSDFAWGHTPKRSIVGLVGGLFGVEQAVEFQPIQFDNPPPLGPAGRVHLSLEDWAKFALLFADGGRHGRVEVARDDWQQLLTSSATDDPYVGGWRVLQRDWADGRVLHHGGSNTTWYCVAWIAPEKGFCLLAATNVFSDKAIEACDQAVATAEKIDLDPPESSPNP